MVEARHETYSFGEFMLDVSGHHFYRGKQEIKLTKLAFKALVYLAKNPKSLVTFSDLIDEVRGEDADLTLDAPKKWIEQIRLALDDQGYLIEVVRGEGWRFNVDLTADSSTVSPGPVVDPIVEVRPAKTETFESWMIGRGRVVSATLLASALIVTPILSVWLYNSPRLAAQAKPLACLAQAIVILIAFCHSLLLARPSEFGPIEPGKDEYIKAAGYENVQDLESDQRKISRALKRYARYWRWLLISWLALYVFLALLGFKGLDVSILIDDHNSPINQSLGERLSLFNTLLNNWNTGMLLLCFYVLNREVKDEPERQYLVDTPFIPFAFCLLIVLATAVQFMSVASIRQGASITSGIAGAIAMALLIGRLQSKFLGPRPWLLIALYSYTAIQPLFLRLEQADKWALVLINFALALKCLLYLYTAWLFQSGDLLFYFARVRRIYRIVPEQRKAFRLLLK